MVYHFPNRTIDLPLSGIKEIQLSRHIKKSGLQYRLVIHSDDEQEYSSQLITARELKNILPKLEKHLSIQVKR